MAKYVAVGKILSPHGVQGEVKVISLTEYPERFDRGAKVLVTVGGKRKPLVIESSRSAKNALLVRFEGIRTREEAQTLDKSLLEISEAELKELPAWTYWRHQVIGLKVYTNTGRFLGEITGVMETGGRDVFVIGEGKEEILIPATREVVKVVSLEQGKMVIEPLPGLLE